MPTKQSLFRSTMSTKMFPSGASVDHRTLLRSYLQMFSQSPISGPSEGSTPQKPTDRFIFIILIRLETGSQFLEADILYLVFKTDHTFHSSRSQEWSEGLESENQTTLSQGVIWGFTMKFILASWFFWFWSLGGSVANGYPTVQQILFGVQESFIANQLIGN